MSNLERAPHEALCGGLIDVADGPVCELITGAPVALGGPRGLPVSRTLPSRSRRMVGAWCFLDAYGPVPVGDASAGMRVPPHPHTGLQTVSWLVAGEVLHRDSLGSLQLVEPGSLSLMTAGRGIAHSEETPPAPSPVLQGVQLWVALPDASRHVAPSFEHHSDLPVLSDGGSTVTVVMGELVGRASPAAVHSPLVGAQVDLGSGTTVTLPLEPTFEHAVLVLSGRAIVDGVDLTAGPLLYLGCGRHELAVRSATGPGTAGAVLLLIGGEPFEERLVMWWNFVGRNHDEIVQFRQDWQDGTDRFGPVLGYDGGRLAAPAMPTSTLKSRGRVP